ncbi:hypothetical protein E4U38_001671 [Claviceps purpurea]|nr:hypothetical protein E4U38_001671 [Claviceps purpurea]
MMLRWCLCDAAQLQEETAPRYRPVPIISACPGDSSRSAGSGVLLIFGFQPPSRPRFMADSPTCDDGTHAKHENASVTGKGAVIKPRKIREVQGQFPTVRMFFTLPLPLERVQSRSRHPLPSVCQSNFKSNTNPVKAYYEDMARKH